MLFTLTDRNYNVLDAYETDDYLIGIYTGYIIKTLDLNISVDDDRVSNWIAGAYIFCKDSEGHAYWFTIRTVEEGAYKDNKTITAYIGTLDILNEDANPVSRPSEAQPFSYYFDKIFYDTGIELGVNEIEGMNRTLEFTSENASNVEMLQYVLNGFDNAEGDLVVDMVGSVPTKVSLNVYKRIGRESSQALVTDQDDSLTELSRMTSIEELATCLNPVGENEDDVDNPITLIGKYYEELDESGDLIYYSPKNDARIYSVKGREKFFVKLPNKDNGEFDGYINRRYVSEAKTQDALWSASLAQLKKIDNVQVEYEVKGDINCRVGDNVTIVSHQMKPPVMLSARVMEYKFNDDDPSRNVYTFGNYQTLESNIDELAKMMAELKKTIIVITEQVVDYALSDSGIEPPSVGWSDSYIPPIIGQWLWTRTTTSLSNGDQTVGYSVSRTGEDGKQGDPGEAGAPGATGNGISSSAIRYAVGSSGTTIPTSGWQDTIPSVSAGQYLWTRTVLTFTNGTTSTSYSIGKMGEQGQPTGITAADTAPTNPYVGMLWKNTGTAGGRIQNVTYRWTGVTWEIFLFHADNISATNLAAITANLGNITAGTLSGSGKNGSIDLNLNTGKISTMSSSPSETSTLDIFGGRLISKVARSGGSIYTEATVGDAAVALRAIDSGTLVHSTTLIPQGFTNYADGSTRLISFSREGMILQPSTANTGNDKNSGLELKGVISYIDFHNSPTSTADFGARIVFGHPGYGPNRLVLLAPSDDVQVQTLGHLHVKNVAGNGYRSVKATSFDTQSAYSVKKDFQQINQEYLLKEIVSTDILSYVYKDAERETRTIGFVIDDGGSPFKSSELLKNVDGKSFSITTAVGMAFGAIKALNKRLEVLEHVAI